jgi:protein Tex
MRMGFSLLKDVGSWDSAPGGEPGVNQGARPKNDRGPAVPRHETPGAFGAALAEAMKRK